MKIKIDGLEVKLHGTYHSDHYYAAVSSFPICIYESLLNIDPIIENNSFTCFENMTFVYIAITDDDGNDFHCYVSFYGDQLDNDCLFEWIAEADLRLEQV